MSTDFMPHGMCYLWDPFLVWLNALSDILIAASYYAIPFLLFYFVTKRRDLSFNAIFVAFGVFILACGTTHLMGAVTIWHPVYRLDGVIKAVTAVASAATFAMLVPMMPALIALPSPSQLERVNRSLAREIEERRAAEEEVRKMNEELEDRVAARTAERQALEGQLLQAQKMEAVGRLAGGVAHDFNNLLTVILGYTDMLREHATQDAPALEYAEEVRRAAERAAALTNQLLAFSRRQMAVPRVISLNDVVNQVGKMLGRIIGEDIQLVMRLAAGARPVKVDPTHMEQVIMNLAVNSRDAMPDGGKLTIETADVELADEYAGRHIGVEAGRYTLLAVSDTGSGMDDATKARLFEPFFTTKEQGKGTGLGLSIVYGIVKQNGGEILVYSEPGQGTVFKIYLPVATEDSETLGPRNEEEIVAGTGGTVLLVEDEEQVRRLTRTILIRLGYHVLEANSPGDALNQIAEEAGTIELLLTDIVMPGMSGIDLARRAAAARPGIRVLYMSGYTEGGVVNQGVTAETPFIQKPFTAGTLQRKIREVLNRSIGHE